MRVTTFKYFVTLAFMAFAGCSKIVEIDLPEPDKKPVVNCFFTHDKALNVHVSLLRAALESKTATVDNAAVTLLSDGEQVAELRHEGDGNYTGPVLAAGENYSLRVDVPGYIEVVAADNLPAFALELAGQTYLKYAGADDDGYFYSELRIKFKDTVRGNNFYGISIMQKPAPVPGEEEEEGEYEGVYEQMTITSTDSRITSEITAGDYPTVLVFRDELFDMQETEITVRFYNTPEYLRLYTFSESGFRYLKGLIIHEYTSYYDLFEIYAPLLSVYSNINNGYGIFAGYSAADYRIPADKTLEPPVE